MIVTGEIVVIIALPETIPEPYVSVTFEIVYVVEFPAPAIAFLGIVKVPEVVL